jgi:diaminohydroxyphosphoribosylaminopyrimidine deaminase/5-amino-6-(5-phosphoribosylamino)uracil reductase
VKIHEKYIKRCIEIAKNGLGITRPNPMVGCVIVLNNHIIGEGFTSQYGGDHAEVNAIQSVKDKSLLNNATLYVTLEPCSHHGKTPPCSDLIIAHKIPNVVIGCVDDNKKVSGRGIKKLKDVGCNVIVGVLESECKQHHKRFFTFHNKKRPYVILKWAETLDGFIAPETKQEVKPVWITNPLSLQRVHQWRAQEQAILVGTNTVLSDNPSLNVRNWSGQNPVRVVIDKNEKLSKNLNVFNDKARTITISSKNIDFNLPIAKQICDVLFEQEITSIIIEGGKQTLQTFVDETLWDEARVFTGEIKFNKGIKGPALKGRFVTEEHILNDVLKIYRND